MHRFDLFCTVWTQFTLKLGEKRAKKFDFDSELVDLILKIPVVREMG